LRVRWTALAEIRPQYLGEVPRWIAPVGPGTLRGQARGLTGGCGKGRHLRLAPISGRADVIGSTSARRWAAGVRRIGRGFEPSTSVQGDS